MSTSREQWLIMETLHFTEKVKCIVVLSKLRSAKCGIFRSLIFFSRPLPKAGRELQTELNTRIMDNEDDP